jgi:hypothetical protein
MVVEAFEIGNTRIKICDDAYVGKTKEDIEEILKRVMAINWDIVESLRAAGEEV